MNLINKSKIGIYTNDPKQGGGIAYLNSCLVDVLRNQFEPVIFGFCSPKDLILRSEQFKNFCGHPVKTVSFHWNGKALLKRGNYFDIPIISTVGSPGFIPKGIKPKWIWASTVMRDEVTPKMSKYLDAIEEREFENLRSAAQIYALSSFTQKRIWEVYGIESEILFPPLKEDLVNHANLLKPKFREPKKGFNFVSAGRFTDPRKNLKLLLDAFRLIAEPEDRLTIIGGEKRSFSDPRIKFSGFLSRNNYLKMLSDQDIFIVSSTNEGFGISALEASGLGLTVVSTPCGGPSSFLSGRGFESKSSCPLDLAESILNAKNFVSNGLKPIPLPHNFYPTHFQNQITKMINFEKFSQPNFIPKPWSGEQFSKHADTSSLFLN